MKKFVWIVVVIIVIVILVLVLSKGKKEEASKNKFNGNDTVIAKLGDISIILDEVGEIKPVKEVNVKSKISGKIKKLYVEEGELIDEGDIIAEVEPDMQQAQTLSRIKSNLQTAEIELETAQKNFNSDRKLYEKDFISDDEWLASQNALKKAEINYQSALEQYQLIQEIGITEENLRITAPVSGTIIQKNVEEGEMVVSSESYSGGTVILTIADLSKMIILAEINEIDIGKISISQPVDISIEAFPDADYKGKITHIAPMAKIGNNNIRVFDIKISIENLTPNLKPGMSANVTIIGRTSKNVITVPIQAIFQDENGNNIVYKVESDTLITPQIVKTGINDLEKVEIIEGIAAGDTISLKEKPKTNNANSKIRTRIRMN
ncbi:efflux RND transporter periplasmic adaptor subunit [candidate division TA06 bacterium]|uniref:Efflux RND transporter periplasmic adaptor subunit n=1 Tax=candidate division TA06 bacterium TaxID=2250710 RepID=A0A660SED6_UNCT6|nr:MAG: efflux RND transporter periplasmic adaptor subunit [candidate division TA06 bacterium]